MKEIMILRREQATSAATSFFESFADEIGSGVGRRLHPFLADGEEPLDFRLGLRLAGRFVQAGFDGLHRASGAHLGARAANVQPRQELEEASEEVASRLVFARELMRGFYGPKAANRILGLSGRPAVHGLSSLPRLLVPTLPGLRILCQKPWLTIRSSKFSPRRPG